MLFCFFLCVGKEEPFKAQEVSDKYLLIKLLPFLLLFPLIFPLFPLRVGRSKSSAIGKLVKKLSSKGKTDKTTKSEETNGTPRGRKTLSSSNSNLEDFMQRVKRSQSMEFLQLGTPVLSNGRKVVTPTPSPGTTPKPGKSIFRARRNSESDLENCELREREREGEKEHVKE